MSLFNKFIAVDLIRLIRRFIDTQVWLDKIQTVNQEYRTRFRVVGKSWIVGHEHLISPVGLTVNELPLNLVAAAATYMYITGFFDRQVVKVNSSCRYAWSSVELNKNNHFTKPIYTEI